MSMAQRAVYSLLASMRDLVQGLLYNKSVLHFMIQLSGIVITPSAPPLLLNFPSKHRLTSTNRPSALLQRPPLPFVLEKAQQRVAPRTTSLGRISSCCNWDLCNRTVIAEWFALDCACVRLGHVHILLQQNTSTINNNIKKKDHDILCALYRR
jgi:hypothetical protein